MISIIIPAYNAEKTITQCLNSLEKQTISRENYEIIVVDDGSKDNTANIVKNYNDVKLITQTNQGPSSARNRGVAEAKGDIVLFTDSDCEPKENWIEEMIKPFKENPEVIGVKGAYLSRQKEIVARFVQSEYEDKYDRMKKYKYIDFIDTYSAGFKRDIFLKAGGYDTSFPTASVEDQEFSFRLSQQGGKMVFNPNALVYHIHTNNLKDYMKKKYKIGYWKVKVLKKHPGKMAHDTHTPQILKLQIIVIYLIPISAFFIFLKKIFIVIPVLLILIFLLSCIPFFIKTFKKDRLVGLYSPFILLLRAIALGWGLIIGTIKTGL